MYQTYMSIHLHVRIHQNQYVYSLSVKTRAFCRSDKEERGAEIGICGTSSVMKSIPAIHFPCCPVTLNSARPLN